MNTKEKILNILSQEGPLLPVELASKTQINSFLIKGYLEELFKEGRVKLAKQKEGSDFIFYLQGQEDKLAEKQKEYKEAVIKISNYGKVAESPELKKKREEFLERLRKIEEEENKKKQEQKNISLFRPEKIEKSNFPEDSEIEEKKIQKPSFLEVAEEYLAKNAKILDNVGESKKSKKLIVSSSSELCDIKYLVIIKDKKKLGKSDLALAYTHSLNCKLPVLLLTCGTLTKTAEEYLSDVGEFLKVKVI